MRSFILTCAALAGVATATPAFAADTVTFNYGASLNNPAFQYGYGVAGTTFTAFTGSYASGCLGAPTLACKTSGGAGDLPAVGINNGTSPVTFYTNTVAPGTLFIQPGFAASGEDAIVTFVAPYTSTYTFAGTISRIDTTTNGNGVNLSAFVNNVNVFGAGGNYYLAPIAGNTAAFNNVTFLNKGDTFTLAVNNNGDTSYDGTGIAGTITAAVPEPATWAMMLIGFGMIGFGMRYRRKNTTAKVSFA